MGWQNLCYNFKWLSHNNCTNKFNWD